MRHSYFSTSTPMLRAVPAMTFMAVSSELLFQVVQLHLRDLLALRLGQFADLPLFGVALAFCNPSSFLIRMDAGGFSE
jgi:hypothetical protein